MNTDIVIVGAGPAGIFTAIEMIRRGSKKHITIVEKGQPIEKRRCPKTVTKHCVNCRPYCHITTGFSGAGAFSDGKLSLSHEVGGDFPTLIGAQNAQDLIDYTDGIYLEFGADSHIEGIGNTEEVREIRRRAIQAGLKLVDCPIRHLGTEKAQTLYLALENYLRDNASAFPCAGATRRRKSARSTPSWRRAAAARTGWKKSAPSTALPTSPERSISACASSAETRSWRRSTACSMRAS